MAKKMKYLTKKDELNRKIIDSQSDKKEVERLKNQRSAHGVRLFKLKNEFKKSREVQLYKLQHEKIRSILQQTLSKQEFAYFTLQIDAEFSAKCQKVLQ